MIDIARERERERERQRYRQREKQAPCREPDVGLDPRSPGSWPVLKATLNHWATQGSLILFLKSYELGHRGGSVKHLVKSIWLLVFSQIMITGSWDQAQSWAPCSARSQFKDLSPLPCPSPLHMLAFSQINNLFFFFKIYLFISDRHRERGRDTGRGRSRLHAGILMWDSILGLQAWP